MRKPRNTTAEVHSNPSTFLADALEVGTNDAIELMETAGQVSFIRSETLPSRMPAVSKAALQKLGFEFLGAVPDDSLFQFVKMPAGWKKVPTDHSMWSNLVDDKGRKRAGIFYKAAFYDRRAELTLDCRFTYGQNYEKFKLDFISYDVLDQGKAVFSTEPERLGGYRVSELSEKHREACEAWLKERFPNWSDPAAYWD